MICHLKRSPTTTQRTPSGVLFALAGARVASKLAPRAKRRGIRFAFAARRAVGECLGAPVFGAEVFSGGASPSPTVEAESVRITERSGVTLVTKADSRGRLSLQKILYIFRKICYNNLNK